jgi:hypothetical protein
MPRPRHPAVVVLAIFHFLMAACCGVCNLGGLVLSVSGGGKPLVPAANPQEAKVLEELTQRMEQAVQRNFPGYYAYQVVKAVSWLVLSLLLVLSGIGLLLMQRWGQVLSLIYAVLGLLLVWADALVNWTLVLPAEHGVLQQPLPGAQPEMLQVARLTTDVALIIGPILQSLYPLIVLVVLLWPSVRAAFRQPESIPPAGEEPFYPGEGPPYPP